MMVPSVFMAWMVAHANIALEIAAAIPVIHPVAMHVVIAAKWLRVSQEALQVVGELCSTL